MSDKNKCETCRAYRTENPALGEGECRAYAPTAFKPAGESPWPKVKAHDWCDEHEAPQ